MYKRNEALEKILSLGRKIIPKKLFLWAQPIYHYLLSLSAALFYGFPAKKIRVVTVTGTKGKSTTAEMINSILEKAGLKTALVGTIRIKIGEKEQRNLFKMTLQGRFFLQKFLKDAVGAGCQWAIIEMTSEAVKQFRHKFVHPNAFVFTNISPEHIESHGSYESYLAAKLRIAREIETSQKKETILVVNEDDKESDKFLSTQAHKKVTYSLKDALPYELGSRSSVFTWKGQSITLGMPGKFNIYNALAAARFAESINIDKKDIKGGLEGFSGARGRVEFIDEGQSFDAVVDYAHTIDSLEKFYRIFEDSKNICVLGNTGGGRDKWKRAGMAKTAEKNCEFIIFTNEDPYDEDPKKIVVEMREALEDKSKSEIIMDRREAIKEALIKAGGMSKNGQRCAVLVTGKGTDPYIMQAGGKKIPWDDATVVREEIKNIIN